MHNGEFGYGLWPLVIGNVIFIMFVLSIIYKPRTTIDWKNMGAIGAFLVALFTEMYGFPLTIYLLTSWLGKNYPVIDPFAHESGHLLSVFFESQVISLLVHPGSDIMLISAFVIIGVAWRRIHQNSDNLVTDGIYRYVRHPQYTGFIMMILAFLIQWPTIITLIMTPILLIVYYRLALKEEKDMILNFEDEYREYMKQANRFFPSISLIWNDFNYRFQERS